MNNSNLLTIRLGSWRTTLRIDEIAALISMNVVHGVRNDTVDSVIAMSFSEEAISLIRSIKINKSKNYD